MSVNSLTGVVGLGISCTSLLRGFHTCFPAYSICMSTVAPPYSGHTSVLTHLGTFISYHDNQVIYNALVLLGKTAQCKLLQVTGSKCQHQLAQIGMGRSDSMHLARWCFLIALTHICSHVLRLALCGGGSEGGGIYMYIRR